MLKSCKKSGLQFTTLLENGGIEVAGKNGGAIPETITPRFSFRPLSLTYLSVPIRAQFIPNAGCALSAQFPWSQTEFEPGGRGTSDLAKTSTFYSAVSQYQRQKREQMREECTQVQDIAKR